MDNGACGPRGDDASADLSQCAYGIDLVCKIAFDSYKVVATINGCDYFAITSYKCLDTRIPTSSPTAKPIPPPIAVPTLPPTLTMAPTSMPTMGLVVAKRVFLENELSAYGPFNSGHSKSAMDWLVTDTWNAPQGATNEATLWRERYVMALFYYSTSGNGWLTNTDWLSNKSVCEWIQWPSPQCNANNEIIRLALGKLDILLVRMHSSPMS